jgi:hypothetical protein
MYPRWSRAGDDRVSFSTRECVSAALAVQQACFILPSPLAHSNPMTDIRAYCYTFLHIKSCPPHQTGVISAQSMSPQTHATLRKHGVRLVAIAPL